MKHAAEQNTIQPETKYAEQAEISSDEVFTTAETVERQARADLQTFEDAELAASGGLNFDVPPKDGATLKKITSEALGTFSRLRRFVDRLTDSLKDSSSPTMAEKNSLAREPAPKTNDRKQGMDRRNFLRLGALGAATLAVRPLDAWAETLRNACDPGGHDGMLKKACRADLEPLEKAELAGALRSSECFRKIAERISLPDRQKLVGLYPGGGSHLATFEMARALFKKRPHLEEVEFIYTEISEIKMNQLIENIKKPQQS